jgi:hypothetical protein
MHRLHAPQLRTPAAVDILAAADTLADMKAAASTSNRRFAA